MSFDTEAWKNADIDSDSNGGGPPEPGVYDVTIEAARAFVSKAGNTVATIDFRVTSTIGQGTRWTDVRGFKNEGQVKAAKAMCARLGIDVDSIESLGDLDSALSDRVGRYFEVEIVQNGEYRNTYVQRALTGESDIPTAEGVAGDTEADDSAVPF